MKSFFKTSFFVILLLLILAFGLFFPFRKYLSLIESHLPQAKNRIEKIFHYPCSIYYQFAIDPAIIEINLQPQDLAKLETKRRNAIQLGALLTDDKDFVPAQIKFKDQEFKAQVRLKGDLPDHFADDQWSLRVELDNQQTILGNNRFSLQSPETRNYLNEWLFFQALKSAGVIALNYDFVEIKLNDQSKGIYAFESHFDQQLLAQNQRSPGPIIKFNEDLFWEKSAQLPHIDFIQKDYLYFQSPIEPFGWSQIRESAQLQGQFLQANQLLENYRQGELAPNQVFDYQTLTSFLALADLFRVRHSFAWHNLRFYYNSQIQKLEPIPFDNMSNHLPTELILHEAPEFYYPLLEDQEFVFLYLNKLDQLLDREYLDQLLAKNQSSLDHFQKLINRNSSYSFDPQFLFDQQEILHHLIYPPSFLAAYLIKDSTNQIELRSLDRIPFKIIGFQTSSQTEYLAEPIILPGNLPHQLASPILISLSEKLKLPSKIEDLKIIYQLPHSSEEFFQSLAPWPLL